MAREDEVRHAAGRSVRDALVFHDQPETFLDDLRVRFPTVAFHACTRYADLPDALARVRPQVIFANKFEDGPYPRAALVRCPGLQWLALASAGVDRLVPWDDDRLIVTNVAGVAAAEMAQYAIAAILGLFQRFPFYAGQQGERRWHREPVRSATGARIGLVGLGHAGAAIARLCRGLGLSVVACRASGAPTPSVDAVYPAAGLHAMLGAVDCTVVCAALTPQTADLLDTAAFAAMRPGAYLVNIARGAIVDEAALAAALNSGQLGGAVLDVVREEPLPQTSPLWDLPNLLITPHSCAEVEDWVARVVAMFADNLARWLAGAPLENRVRSDRGY